MPTYAFDEGFFEEFNIPMDESYSRAENGMLVAKFEGEKATFDAAKFEPEARLILNSLKNAGVTSVFCRYDGGGDEGFAHFERAFRGEEALSLEQTVQVVGSLQEIPPKEGFGSNSILFLNCYYPREMFEALTPQRRVKEALDYFAYKLAAVLLQPGFGTGEYVMYGAFHADLESGEIVDEYADPPAGTFNRTDED